MILWENLLNQLRCWLRQSFGIAYRLISYLSSRAVSCSTRTISWKVWMANHLGRWTLRAMTLILAVYMFLAVLWPGSPWQNYLMAAAVFVLSSPFLIHAYTIHRDLSDEAEKNDVERKDSSPTWHDLSSEMKKTMPRLLFVSISLIFLGWWWDMMVYYGAAAAVNAMLVIYIGVRKGILRKT